MQSIPWRLKARRTSFAQQRNHAKTPLRRSSISIGTELHTLLAPPPHFDYLRLSTCVPSLDGLTSYLLSLLFYMITIREYKCMWSHRFCVSFFPFILSFFFFVPSFQSPMNRRRSPIVGVVFTINNNHLRLALGFFASFHSFPFFFFLSLCLFFFFFLDTKDNIRDNIGAILINGISIKR